MIVVAIVMLCLMVINLPLRLRVMAFIDCIKQKGYFSVRARERALISGLLVLEGANLIFKHKKREIVVHLSADARDEQSVAAYLRRPFVRLIFLKRLNIFFEGGKSDDAFVSAMICATIEVALKAFFAVLSKRFYGMELTEDYSTAYGKDEIEFTLNGVISFSLADIIVGLFMELFRKRRAQKKNYIRGD